MTPTQRAAMEQALEALNAIPLAFVNTHDDVANVRKARVNIAAALAEPAVEPVVWYDGRKFYATPSAAHMDCADIKALRPLYEAPHAQHQGGV